MSTTGSTAEGVIAALEAHRDEAELPKVRTRLAPDEPAIGLRMRDLFAVAQQHRDLPLDHVHRLLDHPAYEPRMAAYCILDFAARRRIDDDRRRELYDVYLGRRDRLTTWDMVDRSAPRVVGGHLTGRDVAPLHELGRSDAPLDRRTAATAPLFFVMAGSDDDVDAAFAVVEPLATDPDPLVHLAVGTFLKHAGGRGPDQGAELLDRHAPSMARPAVRQAADKLPPEVRARFVR